MTYEVPMWNTALVHGCMVPGLACMGYGGMSVLSMSRDVVSGAVHGIRCSHIMRGHIIC